MLASLANSLSKPLAESKPCKLLASSLANIKMPRFTILMQTLYIYAMSKLQKILEQSNPFVLTSIDNRTIILRKDNPEYSPKQNDRILSVDCVLANSERLTEIKEGVFQLSWFIKFYFTFQLFTLFLLAVASCSGVQCSLNLFQTAYDLGHITFFAVGFRLLDDAFGYLWGLDTYAIGTKIAGRFCLKRWTPTS